MTLHNRAPWRDIAFAGAYWNCEARLERLLAHVRPWFRTISVAVQESPDGTLAVAKRYADVVVEEPWLGRGDPSIGKAVQASGRPWVFVISDDEWPTDELLYSFQDAVGRLNKEQLDGAWVHFVSTIDGHDFTREQDAHLRLYRSSVPWPTSQHARPMTDRTIQWRPTPEAFVRHDRTLAEMMTDYVRRYELGLKQGATEGQMAHNRRMMQAATGAVAAIDGWSGIVTEPWWPKVVEHAYGGKAPAESFVAEPSVPARAPRRSGRSRKASG